VEVQALITNYVGDVTARLPRRLRSDVSFELAALLNEDLAARATSAGRAADEAMTLELIQGFGRPAEVAARYAPAHALLDASDTRDFLVSAVIGSLLLLALGQLTMQHAVKDWPSIMVLSWLGFLVVVFGARNAARRRWPSLGRWKPHDRDAVSRGGNIALVILIAAADLCYGAPAWLFGKLTGGAHLPATLVYADGFASQRLPWLLGVWAVMAVLLAVAAVEGRWRPLTRRIEAGLSLAVPALLLWFLLGGPMMQLASSDHVLKNWMVPIMGLVFADAVVKISRLSRPRPPQAGFAAPPLAR
jgi:hypothetical protein